MKGNGHSAIPQTEAGSMQSVPPVSGARFGPVDAPSYSVPLEQIPTVQPGLSTNAMGSARGPLMSQEAIPAVRLARSSSKCQIGYIFCSSDLFTVNSMKRSLYVDLEKDSMGFLADLILTNEGLPQDSTSIELFTHEGYPIVLNDYNKKGENTVYNNYSLLVMSLFLCFSVPLRMWELSNDALFYAFSRPKLQPFWATDEEEFTFVDPCHGMTCTCVCLHVLLMYYIVYLLIITCIFTCSSIGFFAVLSIDTHASSVYHLIEMYNATERQICK